MKEIGQNAAHQLNMIKIKVFYGFGHSVVKQA